MFFQKIFRDSLLFHNFCSMKSKHFFATIPFFCDMNLNLSEESAQPSKIHSKPKKQEDLSNIFFKVQSEDYATCYGEWLKNTLKNFEINGNIKETRLGTKTFHLFGTDNVQKNKIQGRVNIIQHAANNPIQDRFIIQDIKHLNGFFVAIFDGFGGFHACIA